MQANPSHASLLPAGHRWGKAAQSIVPYLAAFTRSRPGPAERDADEAADAVEAIANPVFRAMDVRLAWRDR